MADKAMQGKVCIVTGANSGVGFFTAKALAAQGARTILVCRSADKGAAAANEIRTATKSETVELMLADFASLAAIRKLAADFLAAHESLDVLVNNAGLILTERAESADGYEMTFAVNHLAPFLLTNLLLDALERARPARVVNVSSEGHRGGRLAFDDLQATNRSYSGIGVYCTSKLANVLFNIELAKRVAARGITANSLHPGTIATGFGRDAKGCFGVLVKLGRPFLIGPERGARTQIHLAVSPDVADTTGEYFIRRKVRKASGAGRDGEAAAKLWAASSELVGLPESA